MYVGTWYIENHDHEAESVTNSGGYLQDATGFGG